MNGAQALIRTLAGCGVDVWPSLDFVALAGGMGVPAARAGTAAEFARQLRRALAEPGPHLIEAEVPAQLAAEPAN